MTLQEFIVGCSDAAAKVFHLRGRISPMWHVVTRDGEHLMMNHDKDTAVALIRVAFELHDVVRYVFISEAWQVELKTIPGESFAESAARARELHAEPLANHSEGFEVLDLTGEDEAAGLITARQRIIRPTRSAAYLGPLEIVTPDFSEGRMVGLLPQRGTRQ